MTNILLCTGNTAFGYPEHKAVKSGIDTNELLAEALLIAALNPNDLNPDQSCLLAICDANIDGGGGQCSSEEEARDFVALADDENSYERFLKGKILEILGANFGLENEEKFADDSGWRMNPIKRGNCLETVKTFVHLQKLDTIVSNLTRKDLNPSKLMNWLYTNADGTKEEKDSLYAKMFPFERYPDLYGSHYGATEFYPGNLGGNLPLPDLVSMLTNSELEDGQNVNMFDQHFSDMKMTPELVDMMRLSLHPPHVAEGQNVSVPNPAFPFCMYRDSQEGAGVKMKGYREEFCRGFQTTVNEVGLCYTYNNFDLGMDPDVTDYQAKVRNVKGCGKKKGLRVAVDSQMMATKPLNKRSKPGKFVVYITVPGVVTHKVPFVVDTQFLGEHNFHLHGIHFIDSSDEFKEWNKENKVCYFPDDRNMSFFSFYTQDNCLLECRYNKIGSRCGCMPWYLKQEEHPVCGRKGNVCFKNAFDHYQEDLTDRQECDCKSDCGGIHIFSSMNKYPFSDETTTERKLWWDRDTRTGHLANYLLDPRDVFSDRLTKDLNKLQLNISDAAELADRRFENEMSILNFFFDTPIITKITLEMRITVFDQISAIGGTLGLFTGVSLITFAEIVYWLFRFFLVGVTRTNRVQRYQDNVHKIDIQPSALPPIKSAQFSQFGY